MFMQDVVIFRCLHVTTLMVMCSHGNCVCFVFVRDLDVFNVHIGVWHMFICLYNN